MFEEKALPMCNSLVMLGHTFAGLGWVTRTWPWNSAPRPRFRADQRGLSQMGQGKVRNACMLVYGLYIVSDLKIS